tara:strand:- start:108 stop:584 length:477 start_codon:yes stop_codon:yes gene_type:complete
MKNTVFILALTLISFLGCNKDCNDMEACNYSMSEPCRYSDEEDLLLTGSWNLVDIHDENGICTFSFSSEFDCELDETIESINLIFYTDKTCQVITVPDEFSNSLELGLWSINICTNTLHFDYTAGGPLPFGSQQILQLFTTEIIFEDAQGNILRWEKI